MKLKFILFMSLIMGANNAFAGSVLDNEALRSKILAERKKLSACLVKHVQQEVINTQKAPTKIASEAVELCSDYFKSVEDVNLDVFRATYSEPDYDDVVAWLEAMKEGNIFKSKNIMLGEMAATVIMLRKKQARDNQ
ncbi:hypothetical protein BDD26_3638 [Xenorhabdus cabanillasii]|uniref:Uncharacterized protein n=1 Tax=Xenorhabdus cabanillasii TaxID=351673 RepID=A0A3D9UGT8_9GAMM|nr:hypothetical protein [Xenorhabdus cabanillasii]REF28688.1 hypothetical protein BDD26_3638 [Xenorhabdus cabanillasii]